MMIFGVCFVLYLIKLSAGKEHETEITFFQYYRFSACVDANYDIKESIKANSAMNTL